MANTPEQRAGDGDRSLALDRLGQYFADGYLDIGEFEKRTGAAAVARTRGEIDALFTDLPAQSATTAELAATGPAPELSAQRELDEVMSRGNKIRRLDAAIWAVALILFFVGTFVASIPFAWVVFPIGAFASWGMRAALKVDDSDEELFAELSQQESQERAERLRRAAERRRELGQ
ncbi:MAG TPA: DUF1707 domain-containing protein [Corynebacterium sp.]|nr:DUF1707 domain-containing protein [Corynebacterium sp.]